MHRSTLSRAAILAAAILPGLGAPAGAEETAGAKPSFTVSSQVLEVSVTEAGASFTLQAEPRCRSPRYEIDPAHAQHDTMTALVLAALAAGRSVTVRDAVCQDDGGARVAAISMLR